MLLQESKIFCLFVSFQIASMLFIKSSSIKVVKCKFKLVTKAKNSLAVSEADPEGGEGGSSPGQILNP